MGKLRLIEMKLMKLCALMLSLMMVGVVSGFWPEQFSGTEEGSDKGLTDFDFCPPGDCLAPRDEHHTCGTACEGSKRVCYHISKSGSEATLPHQDNSQNDTYVQASDCALDALYV